MAQITTPFGRHSTAAEVVEGIDLSGKRAIVTGAESGIGTGASEDTGAGCCHLGSAGNLPVAGGYRRSLLRGLQRSCDR